MIGILRIGKHNIRISCGDWATQAKHTVALFSAGRCIAVDRLDVPQIRIARRGRQRARRHQEQRADGNAADR
jgi:hypothetical protein